MSQSQRSPFVRGFEQLFELTPAELDYLQRLERAPHHVPARRMLIEEGRKYDRALIAQTGWLIEYVLLRDGKRQILNFRLPGEIVGVDGLAYAVMPHSVATLAPGVVADLPLASFEALQCEFPRLASALFLMTLREEAILHQWEVRLGRRDAYARVAHLLTELHRRLLLRGLIDGGAFPFPATQEDIADCVGLTTPYVNRILQKMRMEGLIQMGERSLELVDSEGLAKAGGFKPGYLLNWSARLARARA
jgi:CRP-like cAMP-binding protein